MSTTHQRPTDTRTLATHGVEALALALAVNLFLALTARDEDRLETIAADLPGETLVVPADVRDSDAVEHVVDRTIEAFGGIDTLVNNAGVSLLGFNDERTMLTEVSDEG